MITLEVFFVCFLREHLMQFSLSICKNMQIRLFLQHKALKNYKKKGRFKNEKICVRVVCNLLLICM